MNKFVKVAIAGGLALSCALCFAACKKIPNQEEVSTEESISQESEYNANIDDLIEYESETEIVSESPTYETESTTL